MVHPQRFRQSIYRNTKAILLPESNIKSQNRWLMLIKLSLSASIPFMIAIFTIVSYIQQMQIDKNNREKDLEIANLTRIQDQMIANITRLHDLEVANLTQIKDWEIAMANLIIANETKIQDRQIAEENRNEDRAQQYDLHYETLYSKYIEDISTIFYKQPYNQTIFTSEENKMLYIRRKTLMTLRSIDSERRSQLFVFLYENNLLPDQSSPNTTISLIGAHLKNITIESPVTGSYQFDYLSLQSLNLMNAIFIGCTFKGNTNFNGSIMTNVQFIGATFEGQLTAYKVKLINASFIDCTFKKKVIFQNCDLSYAKFNRSNFNQLSSVSVILTNGSFIDCKFNGKIEFRDSVMNGISIINSEFEKNIGHEFSSVSLDYSDCHNISLDYVNFHSSSLSYSNFRGAHLTGVQFDLKTFITNSDFSDSIFRWARFDQTNLFGSTIDLNQFYSSEFRNVVLPNGTWVIDKEEILKNGNAEKNCPIPSGNKIQLPWEEEIGPPILYHHNISYSNSLVGNCSYKCPNEDVCCMEQRIELLRYLLFVESGELQYTLSAYFGSDSECAEGLIEVWILTPKWPFRRKFSNPYIKSSGNYIQWQETKDTFKLPKDNEYVFHVRVVFNLYSDSCYIDNIKFRLEQN
ncbi:unnamed protein product [Adineta steineri]|uniref:Pentapeptide repeat-containing protein n=2 Tax=Adineta steineri TaxID=433720 RepID=A0A819U6P1_9BILA|nr:unnamed protein product [Adineta steineri]CAF4089756.1 unnamed protein product [Adineta steineri]